MEGNGRKLGWIAIALGVVALVVALGGRAQPWGSWGAGSSADVAPRGEAAPPGWVGPREGVGPLSGAGPRIERDFEFRRYEHRGFAGPFHGGLGRFFAPFFLFGGLVRTLLFLLLIFLAVRFLGRRGGSGSSSSARPGAGRAGGSGPEEPPYTGETQNL